MSKKFSDILVPVTAATPEGLSKVMFENNLRHGMWFNYSDPSFQNDVWIAWYMKDIELEINDNILNMKPTKVG